MIRHRDARGGLYVQLGTKTEAAHTVARSAVNVTGVDVGLGVLGGERAD